MDGYAADLKRLLVASGQTVASDGKNRVVIEQFIAGLPRDYARQLRVSGKTATIGECVSFVRGLRSADAATRAPAAVAAWTDSSGVANAIGSSHKGAGSVSSNSKKSVMCYNCNEVGHIARKCPNKSGNGPTNLHSNSSVTCHFCDRKGHIMKNCPEVLELKKSRAGKAAAVASEESTSGGACLCAPSSVANELPRIYVDVRCAEQDPHQRVRAVVDTGSSWTLVTAALVEQLGLEVEPASVLISAIDGSPLQVHGSVS